MMQRRKFFAAGLAGLGAVLTAQIPLTAGAAAPVSLTPGMAVNKAGRQRMLSQRMAKAWLMAGRNVMKDKAQAILRDSMNTFDAQLVELSGFQPNEEVRAHLAALGEEWKSYKSLLQSAPSADGAKKLYELNEKVLAAAQKLTVAYEKASGSPSARLVNLAGRQRMLPQRMAKFYFFEQWGVNAAGSRAELEKARKEFTVAMTELQRSSSSAPQIRAELDLVAQQWLFFDAAVTASTADPVRAEANVATTSERILEQMDSAVGLYEKLAQAGHGSLAMA